MNASALLTLLVCVSTAFLLPACKGPEDILAKNLLMKLIRAENIHRGVDFFGIVY